MGRGPTLYEYLDLPSVKGRHFTYLEDPEAIRCKLACWPWRDVPRMAGSMGEDGAQGSLGMGGTDVYPADDVCFAEDGSNLYTTKQVCFLLFLGVSAWPLLFYDVFEFWR